MTGVSRVLCAVDLDDADQSAFDQALALARSRNARLILLCALQPGEPFSRRASERKALFLRLRRAAEAAGVRVDVSVRSGDTAALVCLATGAHAVAIAVISVEHGRSAGRPWGAVAEDVIRSASCPTLVVPAGAQIRSSFSNVMCAVDLTSDSQTPVSAALGFCGRRECTVTLFHVVGDRSEASAAISRLNAIPSAGAATIPQVAIGAVSPTILEAARVLQPDLLVIGARRRSQFGRRWFGVTRELVASSFCPVLAVPLERRPSNRAARSAA